jgi:hypothetical protein
VVVDDPHRMHEGVRDRRPDEAVALCAQLLRQRRTRRWTTGFRKTHVELGGGLARTARRGWFRGEWLVSAATPSGSPATRSERWSTAATGTGCATSRPDSPTTSSPSSARRPCLAPKRPAGSRPALEGRTRRAAKRRPLTRAWSRRYAGAPQTDKAVSESARPRARAPRRGGFERGALRRLRASG